MADIIGKKIIVVKVNKKAESEFGLFFEMRDLINHHHRHAGPPDRLQNPAGLPLSMNG
jgi:hypothetical protein